MALLGNFRPNCDEIYSKEGDFEAYSRRIGKIQTVMDSYRRTASNPIQRHRANIYLYRTWCRPNDLRKSARENIPKDGIYIAHNIRVE